MKTEFTSNNKLIIIGNGFDLAHGLKTKYSDFMLDFLNKKMDKVWERGSKNYSDEFFFSKPLPGERKRDRTNYSFLINLILQHQNTGNFQFKSALFEDLIKYSSDNWVDIESLYFENLKKVYNNSKDSSFKSEMEKKNYFRTKVKELNGHFEVVKNSFEEYLNNIQLEVNENENIKYIINQIVESVEVSGFGFDSKPIHLLNFNYTSTINEYLKGVFSDYHKKVDLNYIHGKLKDKNNPIVFGYGDETDDFFKVVENLNINDFLKNFKSFGYFRNRNYKRLLNFIERDEKYDVIILGHSCGLSDRVMLKTIFENKNCQNIQMFYYQWGLGNEENDFIEKSMEISRHFEQNSLLRSRLQDFDDSKPLIPFKKK